MYKNRANYRHHHVNPCAAVEGKEPRCPILFEHPHGKKHKYHTEGDGIDDHLPRIELKILLVSCADTGDANHQERHHLAMKKMTILIYVHYLDAVMNIYKYTSP